MRIQGNMHDRIYRSDVWRQIALKVSQTTCYVFKDIKRIDFTIAFLAFMPEFCIYAKLYINLQLNYDRLTYMSKAKTLLKIELLKDGLSMEDLQRLLKSKGYDYTLSSLNSKISRGTFSASFLLQCFEAMGHYNINLNDLIKSDETADK